MGQVITKVFKDQAGIYPNGCDRPIASDVAIIGMDPNVYLEVWPPDRCGGEVITPQSFLKIKDKNGHIFWIQETVGTWAGKVNGAGCCAGSGQGNPITLKGDTDVPAGLTITSPQLYNLTGRILTITLGGIAIYNVPYSSDSGTMTGTLDLTAYGGLAIDQIIQISIK